ncbi:MAG TPA: extracellular solute-binding protein [Acidimicrobiia bacterium]|nr:extracellular solute-binding protein [Acidimicrobiia bacterium]
MKRVAPLIAVAALVLASCGSDEGSGPLIVYSGRSEELVAPLIDRFSEESGIDVEVRYAGSTDLAATLLQEGETTDADVFYAQDPASLGSVASLLAVLDPSLLERVEPRFSDGEGRWVGTSGRVRTFIYNTGTDIELPQTIDNVTDPEWTGRVGVAPTNGSFLAFVSAMILERGEEATLGWLEDLAANDPQEFDSNSPIVAAADTGEVAGGLVNHYYLLRLRAEGEGDDAENWFIPAGDVGSLVMPAGAGIIEGTDMPEAASRFVEFLLSDTSQEYFATETFEFPLVEGVEAPQGLPDIGEIDSPDIDLSELADVLDDATRLVAEAGLV